MIARYGFAALLSGAFFLLPAATSAQVTLWNSCSWQISQAAAPAGNSRLYAVSADSANDAWTVGTTRKNSTFPLAEHWNGSAWSVVQTPVSPASLFGVLAISANDVWAVGSQNTRQSTTRPVAEHWDGSSWSRIETPHGDGAFTSITAMSSNDIWAAGETAGSTLVEHWNGSAWKITPSQTRQGAQNLLLGVSAVSRGDAWAVGVFEQPGNYQTLIEHWNGAAWTIVPSANQSTNSQL